MATIESNIRGMAEMVASVKKETRLSEATIIRIVDMVFALAQNTGPQSNMLGEDEDIEVTEEGAVTPDGQVIAFPELEGDEEVLAAVAEPTEEV